MKIKYFSEDGVELILDAIYEIEISNSETKKGRLVKIDSKLNYNYTNILTFDCSTNYNSDLLEIQEYKITKLNLIKNNY